MSALRDLTAAHGERRKAVQTALKDLSTAALKTQTTLALDEALKRKGKSRGQIELELLKRHPA